MALLRLDKAPQVWQVIAGNAGSKLNSRWKPPFFGFSQINVYTSGKVGLVSYERPVPTSGYYKGTAQPAKPKPEVILYPLHGHIGGQTARNPTTTGTPTTSPMTRAE